MSKAKDIVRLLMPYLMAFPSSKMNEGALLIYAKALEELEIGQIEASMQMILKTSKFFPSVAEIYEKAETIKTYVRKDMGAEVDLSPAEAWENAITTLKSQSQYSQKPYEFATKNVERAVRQFGLAEMLMLQEDGVNTARSQFMRIYEALLKRELKDNEVRSAFKSLGQTKVNALIGNVAKQIEMEANEHDQSGENQKLLSQGNG